MLCSKKTLKPERKRRVTVSPVSPAKPGKAQEKSQEKEQKKAQEKVQENRPPRKRHTHK